MFEQKIRFSFFVLKLIILFAFQRALKFKVQGLLLSCAFNIEIYKLCCEFCALLYVFR